MPKKTLLVLTLTLAVIVFLAACERSAVAPEAQATPTEETDQDPTLGLPDAYKTQTTSAAYTALAQTMQPGGSTVATVETPVQTSTGYWDPTATPTTYILLPTVGGVPGASTPTPGIPTTYTLQQGEFPYCIARRLNIDPDELLSLNNLVDGALYQPGLVLTIPQTGHTFPGTRALRTHPGTYTVQLDDTIYRIACVYGDVDPIYLAAYNGIAAPYTLTTGSVLSIP